MTNTNDVRRAHEVLDGLFAGRILSRENEQLLRSFLPEMPKQKTLEEITEQVYDAWTRTNYNEWAGNIDNPNILLEEWLVELHVQLKGLKGTPVAVPALPEGLRLAIHEEYGRCVVTPKSDANGGCEILYADSNSGLGSTYDYAHECELTFIDAEPAKPTHPEFLETEADYAAAPEGTIVACDDSPPWYKFDSTWLSTITHGRNDAKDMTGVIREVLRWSWGNE